MKKLFSILICLCAILAPLKVEAKSYNFGGYYCDAKQKLDNNTFYMTCHIIVSTDFNINHIKGNLILKNVTLTDIRTNSDWTNNNGLSSSVDFTSKTTHNGNISVADLIFTGNLSDTECEASFEPIIAEEVKTTVTPSTNPTCALVDNEYYGKNGTIVTEERYYEECCNYVCTVVDNKYYFNSEGLSVSYDKFLEDCSSEQYIPSTPDTGINYGYIMLPIGLLSIIAIVKIAKKNSKIYKI